MTRRRFIGKTAAVLATAGAGIVHAPYVIAQPEDPGGACPRPGPHRSTCSRARRSGSRGWWRR